MCREPEVLCRFSLGVCETVIKKPLGPPQASGGARFLWPPQGMHFIFIGELLPAEAGLWGRN